MSDAAESSCCPRSAFTSDGNASAVISEMINTTRMISMSVKAAPRRDVLSTCLRVETISVFPMEPAYPTSYQCRQPYHRPYRAPWNTRRSCWGCVCPGTCIGKVHPRDPWDIRRDKGLANHWHRMASSRGHSNCWDKHCSLTDRD